MICSQLSVPMLWKCREGRGWQEQHRGRQCSLIQGQGHEQNQENGRLPAKCQSHEEMAGDTKMKINIKNGTIAFNSWLQ